MCWEIPAAGTYYVIESRLPFLKSQSQLNRKSAEWALFMIAEESALQTFEIANKSTLSRPDVNQS